MLRLFYSCCVGLSLLLLCGIGKAEVFSWVDQNGIKCYSNTFAPKKVPVKRSTEHAFDEEAYEARRKAEDHAWFERKVQLEKERNAKLEERLRQNEQKLAELEFKTTEALTIARKAQKESRKVIIKNIYPYPAHPYRTPPKNNGDVTPDLQNAYKHQLRKLFYTTPVITQPCSAGNPCRN